MKTDTTNPGTDAERPALSPSVIFPLLADPRRRRAMRYLGGKVGAVAIGDVAEEIALAEGDLTRDRFERIVTGLCHAHLPLLGESGVVRYDLDAETVERLPAADRLTPYLDLAATDEFE